MTHNGPVIVPMAATHSQHREKLNKVRANDNEEQKPDPLRRRFTALQRQLLPQIVNLQDEKSTVHSPNASRSSYLYIDKWATLCITQMLFPD